MHFVVVVVVVVIAAVFFVFFTQKNSYTREDIDFWQSVWRGIGRVGAEE